METSAPKWTLGPWRAVHSEAALPETLPDNVIAMVHRHRYVESDQPSSFLTWSHDADLIAAAPDLHALVERYRNDHSRVARLLSGSWDDSTRDVQTCQCSVCCDAGLVLAKVEGKL